MYVSPVLAIAWEAVLQEHSGEAVMPVWEESG